MMHQNTKFKHDETNSAAATLETIIELKTKLSITERKHMLDIDKMSGTIKKNENTILLLRTKNANYRNIMRSAFENDKVLVCDAFKDRGKDLLAFKDKSAEVVIKEVDQTVCDLARKMNALVYQRQKKHTEYERANRKLNEAGSRVVENLTSVTQLENSLNKVELKRTTASHIFKVYEKIKHQVEADLRTYPQKLTLLEETIAHQKQELFQLMTMQASAHQEMEVSMISKNNFERSVREDRKKRELMLRQMKQKVRQISQQEVAHPNTRRNNRHEQEQSLASKKLAESAKRIEEILEKINVYKYKAEMLESVTGIPFVNEKTMLKCLKNQKNSSDILNKQSIEKKQQFLKLKKILADHKQELNQLMYNEEWRTAKRIEGAEDDLSNAVDNSEVMEHKVKQQRHQLYNLDECLTAMAIYLKQATCALPNLSFNIKNIKETDMLKVFNEVLRVFFLLYQEISNKLNHTDPTSQFPLNDFIIRKRDINKLIPSHNNRIKYKIERRVSEEFGEYNQPTNDEYLSRDAIKARSENKKGK